MWRALLLVAVSGCQCLQPVDEEPVAPDGGRADAGVIDAGLRDAGGSCTRAADCSGPARVVSWCGNFVPGGDAGFSCVDQRCVAQCGAYAGQTCVQDRGVECLRCPPPASCIPPSCGGGFNFTYSVVEAACTGASPFGPGDRIREATGNDGGCGVNLYLQTGGGEVHFGHLFLQSARGLSARIDALGGTCLVSDVPTGAPRLILDCPRCQVALGP